VAAWAGARGEQARQGAGSTPRRAGPLPGRAPRAVSLAGALPVRRQRHDLARQRLASFSVSHQLHNREPWEQQQQHREVCPRPCGWQLPPPPEGCHAACTPPGCAARADLRCQGSCRFCRRPARLGRSSLAPCTCVRRRRRPARVSNLQERPGRGGPPRGAAGRARAPHDTAAAHGVGAGRGGASPPELLELQRLPISSLIFC
jgi:hypothetical protein